MADHAKPTTTDLYTDVLSLIDARLDDIAKQFQGVTPTNIPVDTVRFNPSTKKDEKWNGSAWVDKTDIYNIAISGDAGSVDGFSASQSATAGQIPVRAANGNLLISGPGNLGLGTLTPNTVGDSSSTIHSKGSSTNIGGLVTVSSSDDSRFIGIFSGHTGSPPTIAYPSSYGLTLGAWGVINGTSGFTEHMRINTDGSINVTNTLTAGNISDVPAAGKIARADVTANGGKLRGGWLMAQPLRDQYRSLFMTYATASSVTATATEIVLQSSTYESLVINNINISADVTLSGAGGLDTGVEGNDVWYYIWAISKINSDASILTSGLLSLSSSSPTMPSGYNYKALLGAVRNNSGGTFVNFQQRNNKVYYMAPILIKDASFTTNLWTGINTVLIYPTTAKTARVAMQVDASIGEIGISSLNNGAGGCYFRASPPSGATNFGGIFSTSRAGMYTMDIQYFGNYIYYYTPQAAATMWAIGWEY